MNNASSRDAHLDRPVRTYHGCFDGTGSFHSRQEFMIETADFIKLFRHLHRLAVTRRTLQHYSSPQLRLLPKPIHKGGHKSYYLNPEHTDRLAVVMHLTTKLYLPLKTVQSILRAYPEEHYDLILKGVLTAEELGEIAEHFEQGFTVKDVLFQKVCHVLEALEQPYWDYLARHGKDANEEAEKHVDATLLKLTRELQGWIKTDKRLRMGGVEK